MKVCCYNLHYIAEGFGPSFSPGLYRRGHGWDMTPTVEGHCDRLCLHLDCLLLAARFFL